MGNKHNPNRAIRSASHVKLSSTSNGRNRYDRRRKSNPVEEPISACKAGLIVGLLSILGFLASIPTRPFRWSH